MSDFCIPAESALLRIKHRFSPLFILLSPIIALKNQKGGFHTQNALFMSSIAVTTRFLSKKITIAEADKATSAIVGYGNKEDILRRKMPYKCDYISIIATKNADGGILS